MIEIAEFSAPGGEAAADPAAFFEDLYFQPSVMQPAGAGDACHSGSDDGDFLLCACHSRQLGWQIRKARNWRSIGPASEMKLSIIAL